jgi:dephospho-CoA kinase
MLETRQNLINLGNELRHVYGADVLADRVVQKVVSHQNYVIDSIRHPSEVERLARVADHHFILVAIEAPATIRYDYLKQRGRLGDNSSTHSMEQFLHIEKQERANPDAFGQQVEKAMSMAHYVLYNDGSLSMFLDRIKAFCNHDHIDRLETSLNTTTITSLKGDRCNPTPPLTNPSPKETPES